MPPGFAKVNYQFTDLHLRNYQARKKLQQLQETNAEWLKCLEGKIPKRKKKAEKDPEKVLEEPSMVQPKKRNALKNLQNKWRSLQKKTNHQSSPKGIFNGKGIAIKNQDKKAQSPMKAKYRSKQHVRITMAHYYKSMK